MCTSLEIVRCTQHGGILSLNTQCRDPRKVMGIAAAIPVTVAIFAFIAPFPKVLFTRRLTERFTAIATA